MAGFPPVDSLIGRQVRDLRIVELLGRGGMGAVYRAEHVLLREPRALKVIHRESLNLPHAVERFQREARIAVRLRHPNLVLVHDFFVEEGVYFLVMEFVVGESLGKLIRSNGPLSTPTACRIGIRCCAGLGHAHELGVVHRDLSPENILLQPGVDGPEPKIIDFGIARAVSAGEGDGGDGEMTLTRVGGFVGKPRYASPEQAGRLKRGERIDPRSDLYTFGLILYEMVTGDLPFHSDSEIGYLSLHHSGLPERPTLLHPELAIPLSLERVILRCLEKDRDKRFQSAAELAHALNAVQAGEPALEERPPAPGPSRVIGATSMWSARTQPGATQGASLRSAIPFMIAICSVVALATACLVYIFLTHQLAPQRAAAPLPSVAAAPPPLPALPRAPALVAPSSSPPAAVEAPVAAPSTAPPPAAAPARAVPPPAVATPAPPRPSKLAAQKAAAPPPAPSAVPSLPVLPPEGEERYTLVNLHPDKDRLFDVNYQRSGFIPLCTKVRIDAQDKKVVRFTVLATGQQYEYLHHHVIPDFEANVDRVFGSSCAASRAKGLTSLDQDGIRQGRALLGMTKEGVILAMGYPPEHATPSTESDDWKYWTGKLSTMHVQFQDGRVSNIKK